MAKPLTVLVYDSFGPEYSFNWAQKSLTLNEDLKKPLKVKYSMHKPNKAKNPEEKYIEPQFDTNSHGHVVSTTFLKALDEQSPVSVNVVFAETPTYRLRDDEAGKAFGARDLTDEEFRKQSLLKRAHHFGPARYLDTLLTEYGPDIVISSVGWDDLFASEKWHKKKKIPLVWDSLEALSALRQVPIVSALPNQKDKDRLTGTNINFDEQDSGFILVGHGNYTASIAKHHGIFRSFLADTRVKVTLPFVPRSIDKAFGATEDDIIDYPSDSHPAFTRIEQGNSFVAPLFAGIAMNVILQKGNSLRKQTGFSLSSKVVMMQYIKSIKNHQQKYGQMTGPKQLITSLQALENYIENAYAAEARRRGIKFDPKQIPDQDFVDNTLNLAPIAKRYDRFIQQKRLKK